MKQSKPPNLMISGIDCANCGLNGVANSFIDSSLNGVANSLICFLYN